MAPHPIAVISRCALCDSYFVTILGSLEAAEYRGKKGRVAMEAELLKMQARFDTSVGAEDARAHRDERDPCTNCYDWLRCPTCIEATHGMRYAEWLAQGGLWAGALEPEPESRPSTNPNGKLHKVNRITLATGDQSVLSPCEYVRFEQGQPPPLYMDASQGRGKPKWKLVQGVGPPGLEVDSSRSGRLFKPSLRPFGIDAPMYQPLAEDCHRTGAEHVDIAKVALEAVQSGFEISKLFEMAPLFGENWESLGKACLESATSMAKKASPNLDATSKPKPAQRLAVALGIEFEAARSVVRRAKHGDEEAKTTLWEAIRWEPSCESGQTSDDFGAFM